MSQVTQRHAGARTVEHVPGTVVESARRLAPAAGRAAATAVRHPDVMVRQARRLQAAAPVIRQTVLPILTGQVDDWRAEYAYSLGLQAFIYGYPYIYNARLRHDWVAEAHRPGSSPHGAVNHFWHARDLMDARYRDGGCPNNDTLYSLAWVDVSREPVILSHPDMGDRYFTFELSSFASDNFAYVGQRTTGTDAGHYAIVRPGWRGQLPDGVKKVQPSPTPWLLVLGRTLVDGPDDVPAVRALQDRYRLTPLSLWGEPPARVPERRAVYLPPDPKDDPLAPWKALNAVLAENPPPDHHALLLDQFARIGVGPGLDVDDQPEVVKRELARAAAVGLPLLRRQFLSGDWATIVNGWRYPPAQEGRFGDDYLRRAADQSLAGIVANDPAEAVYLVNFSDSDGSQLSPRGHYQLRFGADELPPVDAFWSLTAYTGDMNLIPNEANRYSIGDRTQGLQREADGAVTIHLQPTRPDGPAAANWLPTSAGESWFVILRMYRPHPEVVAAQWRCPGLARHPV